MNHPIVHEIQVLRTLKNPIIPGTIDLIVSPLLGWALRCDTHEVAQAFPSLDKAQEWIQEPRCWCQGCSLDEGRYI